MRRVLLAFALLALGALPAAGCGGSDGGGTPLPPVKSLNQVASTTEKAGSYRFDMTMRMSMPGQSQAFDISADGAVDESGRRATMTMDFGSLGELFAAQGVSSDDLKMDMIFEWPVAYMRVPFLSEQIPGGKSWVKLDLDEFARKQGVELPSLASFGQSDPSAFLDFLKATGDLRLLGEEKIDGVRATHYLARIDFARYVERLPAKQREQLAGALAQLDQLTENGRVAPLVDAWVDGEGLLRRFGMSFSVPMGAQSVDLSMTMNLRDFGTEVDITPPAAADVADLSQLAG